jgi:hypothetical protein
MSAQLSFKFKPCITPEDAKGLILQIPGIKSVALTNQRTGFALFETPELADAAKECLVREPFVDPAQARTEEAPPQQQISNGGNSKKRRQGKQGSDAGAQVARAMFTAAAPTPYRPPPVPRSKQQAHRLATQDGGQAAQPSPASDADGNHPSNSHRQGGGGGQHHRGRRGQRYQNHGPAPPPIQFITCYGITVFNVPISVTNAELFGIFSHFGAIVNIQRLDNLAMIHFVESESVQAAMVTMNGQPIGGSTVSVSASGRLQVPQSVLSAQQSY